MVEVSDGSARIERRQQFASQDAPSLASIAQRFIVESGGQSFSRACFGVACRVIERVCRGGIAPRMVDKLRTGPFLGSYYGMSTWWARATCTRNLFPKLAVSSRHSPEPVRPPPLLDQPPPLRVSHRFESVVGTELEVDVVQVVAERLWGNVQRSPDGR